MKKVPLINEKEYLSFKESFENLYMDCDLILNTPAKRTDKYVEIEDELNEINNDWADTYQQLNEIQYRLVEFHRKYSKKKIEPQTPRWRRP